MAFPVLIFSDGFGQHNLSAIYVRRNFTVRVVQIFMLGRVLAKTTFLVSKGEPSAQRKVTFAVHTEKAAKILFIKTFF